MTIEIALLISVISASCALYFGASSKKRGDTTDIERKAAESATINVKLDQIGGDVRDIKYDMTAVKKDVQALTERMITVEQSTKSAHHRIDGIEGKE
jgi:outer membrane murein-binding lipoprotein Lpp